METLPFDDPEVKEVIDTTLTVLVRESDRGAALIAAELINNILEKFLQDVFPQDFDSDRLLRHEGPLGLFSSRNDALCAFGLISKSVHRVIDLIRRMRNEAAHSPLEFSLNGQSDRLQEAYKELVQPWQAIDHFAQMLIVQFLFQWGRLTKMVNGKKCMIRVFSRDQKRW